MELDIIKLQTTWNDAAGSLNNNFAKIQQAINTGSGGGGGVAGGGIYEIKYDFLNGNPLSEEDIAFNAEVFDKLSRNEVSALYIVIDDGIKLRFVADSFYYMPPVDGEGDSALLLNFTAETLSLMGLPQRVIQMGSDGSAEEIPLSGSGMSFVHLSRPDEIATFYSNNSELSLLSTLIIDDIDSAAYSLWGRIVDASSGYITYSCSNGDVRRVTFNSDYTIKKRGLIEGVIYLGDNLTDFQKQANLAYATAMKDLNDYDYSNGNKKRVGVVVYYNGDFYNALIFDKSGIVILAGLELQGWIIDEAGNTTLTERVNIGGADIDTSKFATTAQLQELDNILSDEIDGLKDSKQDKINDLETIRSGAALGATALQEHQDISGKQDTLVSGTNIKTINGESILGEGNLTIQGGNGSYDDTEIRNELSRKADVDGVYPDMTVGMTRDMLGVGEGDEGEFLFRPTDGDGSIKDGFASIESVKGSSVVWNQHSKVVQSALSYDNSASSSIRYLTFAYFPYYTPSINGRKIYSTAKLSSTSGIQEVYFSDGVQKNIMGGLLFTANTPQGATLNIAVQAGASVNLTISVRFIDLTQMFGAGNEPTTIEEFHARLPKGIDINAYNEGEVVNMNVEGIKSVGFNQWKAESTLGSATFGQNYVVWVENNNDALESLKSVYRLLADGHDVYYSAKVDGTAVGVPIGSMTLFSNGAILGELIYPNAVNNASLFANIDKKTIEDAQSVILYATNSSAWSVSDICINLVHTGYRNGEYEPYVSDEIALPTKELFPNGMASINGIYDEYDAEKMTKRIGVVDLGTLPWFRETGKDGAIIMISNGLANLAVRPIWSDEKANIICAKYQTYSAYEVVQNAIGASFNPSGDILIYDPTYTDTASFANAMSGVMLYYELDEPIVTTFDKPLDLDYQVWDFGTEEAIAEGKTTPLKASIIYEFNARDTIRANKLALKNKADKTYVDTAIAQAIISTINANY